MEKEIKKKYNHFEFIKYCEERGICIDKITRTFIYIHEKNENNNIIILPNKRSDLFNREITTSLEGVDFNGVKMKLIDLIRRKEIISAIKLFRQLYQLSLKDAKDLVCDNIEDWRNICGTEPRIDQTN